MRGSLLLALVLAACASETARPRPPTARRAGPPPAPPFAELDENADGVIDGAEFAQFTRRMFVRLDANGDGNLSADEYATLQSRPVGPPPRGPRPGGPGGPPGMPPF